MSRSLSIRRIRTLAAAVFVFAVAITASAGQFINYTNVSFANGTPVSEPVTVTQDVGGTTYYVSAWILTTNNKARLWTSQLTSPIGTGNQLQMALPANLDQSGDPLLLANPSGGPLYLLGTSRNQTQCTGANQISLWSSQSAGQPWTGPIAINPFPAVSGNQMTTYFDDKPAALLSKFSFRTGQVFVAFVQIPINVSNCGSAGQQTIRFFSYNPASGVVTPLVSPASGANITNPIIYEDPIGGALWVSYQDFSMRDPINCPSCSDIVFKVSYDGGSSWNALTSISAPGMFIGDPIASRVCSDVSGPQCVSTAVGQTGAFNPVSSQIYVVWQHRLGALDSDVHGSEVLYSMGTPGRSMSAPTPVLADPNVSFFANCPHEHYTFTPAIDFDSSGNAFVTYYDYDHGCSPTALSYTLRGTKMRPYPPPYDSRTDTLFTAFDSHPSTIGATARIGEYQGVVFHNGVFDAVGVMFQSAGVSDIFHLQAVP